MGYTTPSKFNTFVHSVLNKLGHYIVYIPFTSFEGLSGGKLTEDSPSFTDRVKKTLKSIGKTLYDAAISETGQEIGKGVLLTLILAGIAYGLGPRAASVANAMIGNIQSRSSTPSEQSPMSEDEAIYWGAVRDILYQKLGESAESAIMRNLRKRVPESSRYHRNRPEMMEALIQEVRGRGLKIKGSGITDYLKDKAHQAHKYIMSEDGKTLGKTALTALILAAISKGVTDAASYEIYEYADKPNRERDMYNKYRENKSMRSAAKYANEHRKEDGYFTNPEIRI
jgi:hypothetical protein